MFLVVIIINAIDFWQHDGQFYTKRGREWKQLHRMWTQYTIIYGMYFFFTFLMVSMFLLGYCGKNKFGRWALYYSYLTSVICNFILHIVMAAAGE